MPKNSGAHWFMDEEVKWRNIAALVWAGFAAVPLTAIFLFGITADLSRHVFIFSDFLGELFSLKFLMVCSVCATLSSGLIFLYTQHLEVSADAPLNRLQLVRLLLLPANITFLAASTVFFMIVSGLVVSLRYHDNFDSDGMKMGETEKWLMAEHVSTMSILFGCCLGLFSSSSKLLSRKIPLQFLKVQETKFLFLKCKLPCLLSDCASKSARYLYYFMMVYFATKLAIILMVSSDHSAIFSIISTFRVRWLFDMLWSLWLTATCSLVLYDLSWQIFNTFQTQRFSFPFTLSLFSDEDDKVLMKNLTESTPALTQYHAFHELSLIVKQSATKRQLIFSPSRGIENGQPVVCNTIVRSCLDCIHKLTSDISNFHSSLLQSSKNQETFSNEETTRSIPENGNVTNISSPRLWAQFHDTKLRHRDVSTSTDAKPCVVKKRSRSSIFSIFAASNSNPSPREAPTQTLQNVYRDHMIVKWALQACSVLCLKSINEDEYGVVQRHLKDVLVEIIELKQVLEMVEKYTQPSGSLSKLHQSLYLEVKSSLYRIAVAYGTDLLTLGLAAEQKQLLHCLVRCEE